MELAIVVLVFLSILYFLLIKGYLYKLIVAIFGFLGMYWVLCDFVIFKKVAIMAFGIDITYSVLIPSFIVFMAFICTREY